MARKKKQNTQRMIMDDMKESISDIKIIENKPLKIKKRKQRNEDMTKNMANFIVSNKSAMIRQDPFGFIKITANKLNKTYVVFL